MKIFVLGLDEGRLLPLLVPRFNAKADGDGLPLRVFVVSEEALRLLDAASHLSSYCAWACALRPACACDAA